MNAHHGMVKFQLPSAPGGRQWTRLIDSNHPGIAVERYGPGHRYEVTGRSLLLLALD
jgi:hypothetical protein